jgi:hypothetical protein
VHRRQLRGRRRRDPRPAAAGLLGLPQRGNKICGGDDDYFKVELAEGENLLVDLLFNQSKPTENLDLHFLDEDGNDLTPCSEDMPSTCSPFQGQGAQSNESYQFYVDETMGCGLGLCTFYIVVHGWNGSENGYDLVIDLEQCAVVVLLAGCSAGGPTTLDTGLDGLALTAVNPRVVVPGACCTSTAPPSSTRLSAPAGCDSRAPSPPRGAAAARSPSTPRCRRASSISAVSSSRVDTAFLRFFPAADGRFDGTATIEVESTIDYATHESEPLNLRLEVHDELAPRLDMLEQREVIYVNHPVQVTGDGLLLGGDEGQTVAVVEGCFVPQAGGACTPVARAEVPVVPAAPYDRTRGSFAFAPAIAGIRPGSFRAQVKLKNVRESAARSAEWVLLRPSVASVGASASLGQFLDVRGGGFVGDTAGHQTTLALRGTFTRRGGSPVELDLIVVPRFASGPLVRYVLNEDDALGKAIDLRKETGTFSGTVTPVISTGTDSVTGDTTPVSFRIAR